jgi:hypothetical protein
MSRSIDRASILKLGGAAGIATLIESLSPIEQIAAAPLTNPMNLTIKTTPTVRGPALCYTIIIGDKVPVPSSAIQSIQTQVRSVNASVHGNWWKPKPDSGSAKDQWLTIYVTSCR